MTRFFKKALLPVLLVTAIIGFYEQSRPVPNRYVMLACIVIFLLCLGWLSRQIPSKNEKEDGEIQ